MVAYTSIQYYCNTVCEYTILLQYSVRVYNTVAIQCAYVQWPAHNVYLYNYYYYHTGAGPTKLVPMQNESTKDLQQRVVRDTFISLLALHCVTFLSPKRYNLAVFIDLRLYLYISGCTYISQAVLIYLWLYLYISGCIYISPAVLIYLRLYLYISGCTYISPAVFIYLRLYLYISGCIYISLAVFTYLQFYTILTQTAPEDFDTNGAAYINSGCIYIYPAVLIYLRLYLYISGCIYISPAVFIYIRLYLYISGCIYISLAVLIYIRFYSILTQTTPHIEHPVCGLHSR